MEVTVLLSFKNLSPRDYLAFGDNVIHQITTNDIFASLKPLVDPVIVSHGIFRTAFNIAKTGDGVAKENRDTKHKEELVLMVELAKGVEKLANGSRAIIIASGFKPSSEMETLTELQMPTNFKVYNLVPNGSIKQEWDAVPKKNGYALEMRVFGTDNWQAVAYPTTTSWTIHDLTRGLHLEFRIRATGTRGIMGKWSDIKDVHVD